MVIKEPDAKRRADELVENHSLSVLCLENINFLEKLYGTLQLIFGKSRIALCSEVHIKIHNYSVKMRIFTEAFVLWNVTKILLMFLLYVQAFFCIIDISRILSDSI